jgi:hypothetical protein
MLDDGTYDAIVVDAEPGPADGAVRLELAIAAGPRKGELVGVTATGPAYADRDPLDLLALPATIVVLDGTPTVTIDD